MISDFLQQQNPVVQNRIVHIDLKGVPPTFPRLLELLTLFRHMRFTAVLMEWEDVFPWQFDTRLQAPHAYSVKEIHTLAQHCNELELELIPLVQTLGHSENVLRQEGYEALREVPTRTDVFHPLHPDAPGLVRQMVMDVFKLLPDIRYFHLGGDEVYTLGTHPESRSFVQNNGISALYLHQLNPVFQELEARDIRPILWHDEVASWTPEEIKPFAERADLMVWGYTGDPRDPETYHHRLPQVKKLASLGCRLWAATAYKGADGPWANLPDTPQRAKATRGWVELSKEYDFQGVVCTGWSRYASGRIQVTPIEGALDSLLFMAVLLVTGVPSDSMAECRQWLEGRPEAKGVSKIRSTLERFSQHVNASWNWVRQLEEQQAHLEFEPHRAGSGIEGMLIDLLEKELASAHQLGVELEHELTGLIPDTLGCYYRRSRLEPLQAAFQRLKQHVSTCQTSSTNHATSVAGVTL
jgi:hexosaminidase